MRSALAIRIVQKSSPKRSVRSGGNWLALVLRTLWVSAVVGGSKTLCSTTKLEDREKEWQAALIQMRFASVVLTTVFNGIPFEALQLLRSMERRFLHFACQSFDQSQKTLHPVSLAHAISLGDLVSGYLRLKTFQHAQMITARTIHPKKARRSTNPIKSTAAVPAMLLTMALLFSDMYCQRGIKAMTTPKDVATVPPVSIFGVILGVFRVIFAIDTCQLAARAG